MKDRTDTSILVIEDEAPVARAIGDRLVSEGFKVKVARNGKEGLDFFFRDPSDVLILDLAMPKVSGMEMMRQLREAMPDKNIPIIIYTNLFPDDEILKGVSRDKPAYYLSKTEHGIEQVIEMIDKIMSEADKRETK